MSNFTFSPTDIPGVQIVDVKCFGDARGYFMETYKAADFAAAGITDAFVQDNQSCSHRGVLRGLHFQKQHQQAKLVRAISGEIFDVAVDLRRGSATYGRWVGVVLSAENRRQLYIPARLCPRISGAERAGGLCLQMRRCVPPRGRGRSAL